MASLHLLIVTGLSGAGKSLALSRLEDMGYFCVDNLPSALSKAFIQLCQNANPPVTKAAVAIDARESILGGDWSKILSGLYSRNVRCEILFLDCRDDVLVKRFSETRRKHPLAPSDGLMGGISRERELLMSLRDKATYTIDTSNLKPIGLAARLEEILGYDSSTAMQLMIVSFGYKRGVPIDADFVFDMRFMPNPFYEPELRQLSGLDKQVQEYCMNHESTPAFFDRTEQLLKGVLPGFAAQGKQRLMVAFGCTGGRHRSVAAADIMTRRFATAAYNVRCYHRDLTVEAQDIRERFSHGPFVG